MLPAIADLNRTESFRADGFRSMVDWLVGVCHVSTARARLLVDAATDGAERPELAEALADGRVTLDVFAPLASIATPETDAELAREAEDWPPRQARRLAREVRGTSGSEASRDVPGPLPPLQRRKALGVRPADAGHLCPREVRHPAACGASRPPQFFRSRLRAARDGAAPMRSSTSAWSKGVVPEVPPRHVRRGGRLNPSHPMIRTRPQKPPNPPNPPNPPSSSSTAAARPRSSCTVTSTGSCTATVTAAPPFRMPGQSRSRRSVDSPATPRSRSRSTTLEGSVLDQKP